MAWHVHPVNLSHASYLQDGLRVPVNGSVWKRERGTASVIKEGPCVLHLSQAGVPAWPVRSRLAARSSRPSFSYSILAKGTGCRNLQILLILSGGCVGWWRFASVEAADYVL